MWMRSWLLKNLNLLPAPIPLAYSIPHFRASTNDKELFIFRLNSWILLYNVGTDGCQNIQENNLLPIQHFSNDFNKIEINKQ